MSTSLTKAQKTLLTSICDEDHLIVDDFSRAAQSGDASLYRIIPKAIVRVERVDQISRLIEMAPKLGLPLTFRGSGTSLSGQAIGSGILVQIEPSALSSWKILDKGRRVAFGSSVKAGFLNTQLKKVGRRIGPDPASINSVTMGGVLANNASGMYCDVTDNSYETLDAMRFILANGFSLDSAAGDAGARFRAECPDIVDGLLEIRHEILADEGMAKRIAHKFRIKNTSGYGMNSFLDFEDPLDILTHLLIGSEGTLGFIEGAVLRTVPDLDFKTTALLLFATLDDAARAVSGLERAGAAAVELLDRSSLKVARSQGVLDTYRGAIEADHAGLLVELEAHDPDQLDRLRSAAETWLHEFDLLGPVAFQSDAIGRERLWQVRKQLFPSVSSARTRGTAVVIEDLCVDVARIPEVIRYLHEQFQRFGFDEHVIFGHARSGNLHFVLHPDTKGAQSVARYAGFMEEIASGLVDEFDGSLKAEHGTGRNMAPFLIREWGEDIYRLMVDVKNLLDPQGILNPGVIINSDKQCHLKNLKRFPQISETVDGCMECGFCETTCPSFGFTLSPRQRIVALRSQAQNEVDESWLRRFRFQAVDSCAADGLCAHACPFDINTGDMMKQLRGQSRGGLSRKTAAWIGRHLPATFALTRAGLSLLAVMRSPRWGRVLMHGLTGIKGLGPFHIRKDAVLPRGQGKLRLPEEPAGQNPVVYFPTCINLTMGAFPGEIQPLPLPEAVVACLQHLGFSPFTPRALRRCCCGTPFFSKGFDDAGMRVARHTLTQLWQASAEGEIPVVTDVSPCAAELKNYRQRFSADDRVSKLNVFELAEFLASKSATIQGAKRDTTVLHPNCTMVSQGVDAAVVALLNRISRQVIVPDTWGCCGYAGDRGLLVPELTEHATGAEAMEVNRLLENKTDVALVSGCRTCEMGLSQAVGRPYQSYVFELYRALAEKDG